MSELSQISAEFAPAKSDSREAQFAGRMILRIIAAYPNQAPEVFDDTPLGKEAGRLWKSELIEMVQSFGEKRVEQSLTNWIRRSEYMPEISQVRDGISPNLNAQSRYDPNCPDCSGLGWKTIPAEGKRPQSVERCDCYKKKARPA